MSIKIGINGFGRIGRTTFRAALKNPDFEIVHINDLTNTKTLAHLLKYDSVHGTLDKDVSHDDGAIKVGGKTYSVSAIKDPAEIPWGAKGAQIVFECTGIFKKRDHINLHLKAGAQKVIVSSPADGEDITVVYGVNHKDLKPEHTFVSNGSCTTNCLAPVAKIINDNFGIEHGLMTTVHAYTNDQIILDSPHSDLRRARAAAMSMIPTSTGAAKAISLVIPELKGKLHGVAVRVPTPNVSLVDVTFLLKKSCKADEVNNLLRQAANGDLKNIMGVSDVPLVSVDYCGDPRSSIVDAEYTTVMGDRMLKILSWYDNECGFSHRMLDVAKLMA